MSSARKGKRSQMLPYWKQNRLDPTCMPAHLAARSAHPGGFSRPGSVVGSAWGRSPSPARDARAIQFRHRPPAPDHGRLPARGETVKINLHSLRQLAKDVERFDPSVSGNNVETYIDELRYTLQFMPEASEQEKAM